MHLPPVDLDREPQAPHGEVDPAVPVADAHPDAGPPRSGPGLPQASEQCPFRMRDAATPDRLDESTRGGGSVAGRESLERTLERVRRGAELQGPILDRLRFVHRAPVEVTS